MNETTSWSSGRVLPVNVLVAYASRHGSTAGIAQTIAEELGNTLDPSVARVRCLPAADVSDVAEFDAVVLGSALYYGRWLGEARKFLARCEGDLGDRDVWLFSSGPLEELDPATASKRLDVVATSLGALEHRTFAGRLEPNELSRLERTVTRLVHGPVGDFRDFTAIRCWARQIADHIRQTCAARSA